MAAFEFPGTLGITERKTFPFIEKHVIALFSTRDARAEMTKYLRGRPAVVPIASKLHKSIRPEVILALSVFRSSPPLLDQFSKLIINHWRELPATAMVIILAVAGYTHIFAHNAAFAKPILTYAIDDVQSIIPLTALPLSSPTQTFDAFTRIVSYLRISSPTAIRTSKSIILGQHIGNTIFLYYNKNRAEVEEAIQRRISDSGVKIVVKHHTSSSGPYASAIPARIPQIHRGNLKPNKSFRKRLTIFASLDGSGSIAALRYTKDDPVEGALQSAKDGGFTLLSGQTDHEFWEKVHELAGTSTKKRSKWGVQTKVYVRDLEAREGRGNQNSAEIAARSRSTMIARYVLC